MAKQYEGRIRPAVLDDERGKEELSPEFSSMLIVCKQYSLLNFNRESFQVHSWAGIS